MITGIDNLSVFLVATLALNLTPGPDMLYVIGRTVGQGRRSGVVSALGIGAGCLFHVLAAAIGISAVLAYSAIAFQLIKYAGATYLIYLGVRMLLGRDTGGQQIRSEETSLIRTFGQGAVINILNPKVALFFLAFLPQFVSSDVSSAVLPMTVLGLCFLISGTSVLIVVSLVFSYGSKWLVRDSRFNRMREYFTGSIFVLLGFRLALAGDK